MKMEKEILDYIKKLRKDGYTLDEIQEALINSGHSDESVNEHINHYLEEERLKEKTSTRPRNSMFWIASTIAIVIVIIIGFSLFAYVLKNPDVEADEIALEENKAKTEEVVLPKKLSIEEEKRLNTSIAIVDENKKGLESGISSAKDIMPDDFASQYAMRTSKLKADVNSFLKQPTPEAKTRLLDEIANLKAELKQQYPKIEQSKDAQKKLVGLLNSLTYLEASVKETEVK